jgi:hypothetical protein
VFKVQKEMHQEFKELCMIDSKLAQKHMTQMVAGRYIFAQRD